MRVDWDTFKTEVASRSLLIQFVDDGTRYHLVAKDDWFLLECQLHKDPSDTTDLDDFENNYKDDANKSLMDLKNTPDQHALRVAAYRPEGSSATKVSHDWTDPTTWYGESVEVTGETLTTSDDLTFSALNDDWIDLTNGKVYDEFNMANKREPVVYVDDVETTTGFTVDYSDGSVTFSASQAGKTIKADYWHQNGSCYLLEPDAGKILIIEHAELQFTKDIEVASPISFEVWVYNPYFNPANPVVDYDPTSPSIAHHNCLRFPYQVIKYKNMKDMINAANLGTGEIPAVGELQNPTCVYPFNYATVKPFKSSQGAQLRICLDNDTALGGEWGTATFYILSEDE